MPEQKQTFEQLIQAQTDDISALLELMEKETAAIATRKATQIEACAKQKLKLIQTIQQRDTSLTHFPQLKKPSDKITQQIAHIQKILLQCHQLNETNGVALQRAHLSMHKLRNLFQEAAGKNEMTYDCEGQAMGRKTLGTNVKA